MPKVNYMPIAIYNIIEDTAPLKRYYKYIELHPFNEKENALNNPFIREIEKTGIIIQPNEIFTFG